MIVTNIFLTTVPINSSPTIILGILTPVPMGFRIYPKAPILE